MPNLFVWIPYLPPTSNHIYSTVPARGSGKSCKPAMRVLSQKARKFKTDAMRVIQKSGGVTFKRFKANVPYELTLALFFEHVEIKKSKNDDRYVKMDLSNRVKLIEDTIAAAVGLDDSHNFRVISEKHCDPDNPGIYVSLRPIPEEEVGLRREEYEQARTRRAGLGRSERDRDGPTVSGQGVPRGSPRAWVGYPTRVAQRHGGVRRRREGSSRR